MPKVGKEINIENLDKDIGNLVDQLNDSSASKIATNATKKKKQIPKEKEICPCAVKATTLKAAQEKIEAGRNVYLLKDDNAGKVKNTLFTNCTRTTYEDNPYKYCYKHLQSCLNDPSSITSMKDIIKTCEKVTTDHSVFVKKTKAMKNKINGISDNLLFILNNKKLSEELEQYCIKMVKENSAKKSSSANKNKVEEAPDDGSDNGESDGESDEESEDKPDDVGVDNEKTVDKDSDDECSDEASVDNKPQNVSDDKSEDDSREESDVEESNLQCKEIDDVNSENSEDEESGIEVEEIMTKNGRQLYYEKENNRVIEPEGDGEGTELGKLIKTTAKDAEIEFEGENYFVGKLETYKGVEYTICTLSNNVLNSKMKLVGTVIKMDPLDIQLKKKA